MGDQRKRVAILGFGDIGRKTAEIISKNPDKYKFYGIATRSLTEPLVDICKELQPAFVSVGSPSATGQLKVRLNRNKNKKNQAHIFFDEEGLTRISTLPDVDIVVNALSTSVGICATIEAVKHGKFVPIANKESISIAGSVIMPLTKKHGMGRVFPIDSEISAVERCISAGRDLDKDSKIQMVFLPSSGGIFYDKEKYPIERLHNVTPEETLEHKNWPDMGPDVKRYSALLANKILEALEVHYFFDIPFDNIQVVIEKTSQFHGGVLFSNGVLVSQLGPQDMKIPILHSLLSYDNSHRKSYHDKDEIIISEARHLNFNTDSNILSSLNSLLGLKGLVFDIPDKARFPIIEFGMDALKEEGTMHAAITTAIESSVQAFAEQKIRFTDVNTVVLKTIQVHRQIIQKHPDLDQILSACDSAKETSSSIITDIENELKIK